MATYLYAIKSPIKYRGKIRKSGTVEMPEDIADSLLRAGALAVASAAEVPNADDDAQAAAAAAAKAAELAARKPAAAKKAAGGKAK